MKTPAIFLLSFCWVCQIALGQKFPDVSPEVQEIVDRWGGWAKAGGPVVSARMSEEERQVLRNFYRAALKEADTPDATRWVRGARINPFKKELLYLGDPQIVAETVKASLESDPLQPNTAGEDLYWAALPEVIPMVAPRIFVDEPYVFTSFGDNGGTVPKSYGCTGLIRWTLETSPVFSDEVRKWAKVHFGVQTQLLLPVMRQWWKENEPFFKEKNYRAVKPGIDIYTAEKARRDAYNALHEAHYKSLRAQGKDPSDRRHWDNWDGKKFHPALTRVSGMATPAPKPPPVAPQAPDTAITRQIPVWWWMLGLVILAGIGILVWKQRRK